MSWQTCLAVYFVVWWLTLFMVLPWGVNRVDPQDLTQGGDPGSPAKPRLLLKFFANSLLAGVILGIIYWVQSLDVISFR